MVQTNKGPQKGGCGNADKCDNCGLLLRRESAGRPESSEINPKAETEVSVTEGKKTERDVKRTPRHRNQCSVNSF